MIRRVLRPISFVIVFVLKPFKLFAWRTQIQFLKRLILTLAKPIDFVLILMNTQNEAMLIHWRVYKGNFIFGDGVMVTDYETTAEGIKQLSFRGNNFMGVNIVSSESDVFASNAGILNQNQPVRRLTRDYMDAHIFTESALALTYDAIRQKCDEILSDWSSDPKMTKMMTIRSAATRIFLKLLSDITVTEDDAKSVTFAYVRRFVELSLFGRYLQFISELLGSRKYIRKDAYFKLKEYGIDTMVIDVTLFAAMFSVGTLVIRCVEDLQRFGINYKELDQQQKRHFIIEAVRLFPTVTSVHRMVERDESTRVCNREIQLTPGDEVIYPFVCSNRDADHFPDPTKMKLDRSAEEYDKVLSWSKGPHSCPGKEMSILVTMVMLDQLSEKHDLSTLKIFNPSF